MVDHETCTGLRKGPASHPRRRSFACLDHMVWGEMPTERLTGAPEWSEADYDAWMENERD